MLFVSCITMSLSCNCFYLILWLDSYSTLSLKRVFYYMPNNSVLFDRKKLPNGKMNRI